MCIFDKYSTSKRPKPKCRSCHLCSNGFGFVECGTSANANCAAAALIRKGQLASPLDKLFEAGDVEGRLLYAFLLLHTQVRSTLVSGSGAWLWAGKREGGESSGLTRVCNR